MLLPRFKLLTLSHFFHFSVFWCITVKELFALSKKEPTTVSKSLQHIGMNKIFHKTLILCGHPLRRMVGIMMRPQRARRATIICSVGSWDPTIVPTPDSTEGNYFRITTRSAAAARSSSSVCSSRSSRLSGGNCLFPPPTAQVAPLHGTVWETIEHRTAENSGGKQPVEIWREQESWEFERMGNLDTICRLG